MSFFKRLRPASRASYKEKEKPTFEDTHSNHSGNSGQSANPSDNSNNGGSSTPQSSLPSSASTTSVNKLGNLLGKGSPKPDRPMARSFTGDSSSRSVKRHSMSNLSTSMTQAPKVGEGFYSPVVTNIENSQWVHTKVVLLRGYCGDPSKRALDGRLVVTHDKDHFPSTSWNVHDGQFKVLVHLSPGPNAIRLEFFSQKLADNKGPVSLQRRDLRINYLPMNNSPPLRLAILVASDSQYTFDTTPERLQSEGNNIHVAVRKFRLAAQLWQTFTAEKMRQGEMGRRTFRLEEEYTMGTLSYQDNVDGVMRNEPLVSIVHVDSTTEQLRMMSEPQLVEAATQALRDHLRPFPEQVEHVAAMLLDTHWDTTARQLLGHAAACGGDANIKLALYGSHALHAYPSFIEDVAAAFEDSTRTNAAYVGNEDGMSGSSWEAANTAIWGHLREVSRLFGCEEQASGIMCPKQFPRFSRTFVTNESYSTAEQRKGIKPVMETDEMGWCKLDLLRFRCHPCFRVPTDPAPIPNCDIQFWPLNDRRIIFSARNGITFIEAYAEGDRTATLVRDFIGRPPIVNSDGAVIRSQSPTSIQLNEKDIRSVLTSAKSKGRVRVVAHSAGTAKAEIVDLAKMFEDRKVKMPTGKPAYRSPRIGSPNGPAAEKQDIILHHAIDTRKLLQSIKIFFDAQHIFGLEFLFEGMEQQMLGSKGDPGAGAVDIAKFDLGTRDAEVLGGFDVRAGAAGIEGIRILTSIGRTSPWYGNQMATNRANDHMLMAPAGFSVAGVSGTMNGSLSSFAVLVKM